MTINDCTVTARLSKKVNPGKTRQGQIVATAYLEVAEKRIPVRAFAYAEAALTLAQANVNDEVLLTGSFIRDPQTNELSIKARSVLLLRAADPARAIPAKEVRQ